MIKINIDSDLSNPEKVIELCLKHDICEKYRIKVVALGRPLLKAEAKMFERYDQNLDNKIKDSKKGEDREILSSPDYLKS